MRIGRVSRVRVNRLPTNSVIRHSPSSGGVPLFLAMYQGWLIRPVNRIGHVKTWGYWCIYACIGRMSMCSESSTHGVHYGVITVPIYQCNNI